MRKIEGLALSGLLALGTLTGCSSSSPHEPTGPTKLPTSVEITSGSSTLDPETIAFLSNKLPEVLDLNLIKQGDLETNQSKTKILIFETVPFDPKRAVKTLAFFEQFGSYIQGEALSYKLDSDNEIQFEAVSRAQPENYVIFAPPNIYPGDPRVATSAGNSAEGWAITLIKVVDQLNTNALPLPNAPYETLMSSVFDVEACQRAIEFRPTAGTPDQINGISIASAIQEAGCNTLGRAFASRQSGVDYQTFADYISKQTIQSSDGSVVIPQWQIPQEIYESIPGDIGNSIPQAAG